MEPNQVDVLAAPVFGHFEEVCDAVKAAGAREIRSNVGEGDRDDRVNFNRPFFHPISLAHRYVWPAPYANARRNFAGSNSVAEIFHE